MSRFNRTKKVEKVSNLAGGLAYRHGAEMELIVSCLTTFLDNKFYESGSDRAERIKNLCREVKPEFLGKLAIVSRNVFHLRSVSHLLVGELARLHRGTDLVSKVIEHVAERPDDLTEIVAYLGKPLPKQVKRGIRHALLNFSPYQLAKYRGESKDVSLVDLFNLTHPNPKNASKEQKKAWKELIDGTLKNEETWESRLSSGEDKKKVWRDMVCEGKIGYMALLRNLRNISEQGDAKTIKEACKMLADRDQVKKSKQLPFRFFNAYENVSNQDMLESISEALEHSLDNVPVFEGKTLVAVDSSGSMNGDPLKKASIFAAALIKANKSDVILYDESVKELKVLKATPLLTISESIQKNAMGGGTNTSLVFSYAMQKEKYDRIVILSDNESWQDSYRGGTQDAYQEYKKTGADPVVYAIDIAGHGTKDVKGAKVFHLAGWADTIFDFMRWIEKENELVDFVEAVEL